MRRLSTRKDKTEKESKNVREGMSKRERREEEDEGKRGTSWLFDWFVGIVSLNLLHETPSSAAYIQYFRSISHSSSLFL